MKGRLRSEKICSIGMMRNGRLWKDRSMTLSDPQLSTVAGRAKLA